ncbi:odorant receptor 10-like isoform X2 [Linepithema humile]|uniref:odorant receptor 10-like isoform X2 n=1 Tax=Linepithema humile TaxID=83485 RepID=UPI00351F38B5
MKQIVEYSPKMIQTNSQKNYFNHAVQVTHVILQVIGAWPIPKLASKAERIAIRLQNVLCYFLFAFILVPGLLLVFLKERDFKRRVRMLGPLLNCGMGSIKYSLLVYHSKEIRDCIKQVRQDWKNTMDKNDQKVMLSKASIGRKFAVFSAAFMYVGGLSYRTIVPLSKGRMLTPMNTTVRALACPSYFIKFDEQASPAYEIVFTLQFFAGFLTYSVTCGAAGLAAFFIMHVCGQLSILIGKLQHLNDMKPEDRAVAILLADIVEHQIKVKNFLKQVEEAMQYIWLVEIVGSTVLLCLTGYYVIMSIKVGLMTSMTDWHRLPHKRARTLILIIAISNIPAKISAGKMIEMSLPTFGNIIKTSMAYFNLLRKFIT